MKSKTSFFNKAVFKKNVALYWPIWACYLLYGLFKVPGRLWYVIQSRTNTESVRMDGLGQSLEIETDIVMIAIVAVITGMAVFNYLFTIRSANMIHALPVTRTELFFTNVISGLSFMIIPQLITFFTTVILCLTVGITSVQFLLYWLVSVLAITFFMFSMVCFCAMFTGIVFALPVYFIVLNFLVIGIVWGIRYVLSFLGYGVSYTDIPTDRLLRIFSPLNYLCNHVKILEDVKYDNMGDAVVTGLRYTGIKTVAAYAAVAVFIYFLAYFCYRRRQIERTGDLISFSWLKPVFRWSVGISIGYAAAALLCGVLSTAFVEVKDSVFFTIVVLLGIVGFFIAEMFVQKSFLIFKNKKRWKECGLFLVFIGASCGIMYGSSRYLESYIPPEEEIEQAYITYDYPVEFTGKDMQKVMELQRDILSKEKEFTPLCRENKGGNAYISVTYRLKDGNRIDRIYEVPINEEVAAELKEKIYAFECETDNFMRSMVGYDYREITQGSDVQLEYRGDNNNYVTIDGDADVAIVIYQAMIRDAESGTLQKYNVDNYQGDIPESQSKYPTAGIYLYYRHNSTRWQNAYERIENITAEDEVEDSVGANTVKEGYTYLYFGEDCMNIIDALVQTGMIGSKDELRYTYMSENY